MIGLFRRSRERHNISALYGTIVAQARLPCFYRDYEIADTVNGRFDLILLHLVLLLRRLHQNPRLHALEQGLFDYFCQDMDHNLREIGISDLKVPKEMRRMGEAFYGRAQAYGAALEASDDSALEEALIRNIYGMAPSSPVLSRRLAAYVRQAAEGLQAQDDSTMEEGRAPWPDPEKVPR